MVVKRRILIIDDEESFAEMVKINLELEGNYEVRVESKGASGLSAAREFEPDLILLDVIMRDISGPDVAKRLRESEDLNKIPIVFLSAVAESVVIHGMMNGESYPFIQKPVSTSQLIQQIERQLSDAKTSKRKILIVDDEVNFGEMVKMNLEQAGRYIVDTALNAKECYEKIKKQKYHVIFLDVLMPKIEGHVALGEIKKMCDTPVVIMSAYLPHQKMDDIVRAGAYKCLEKPVELDRIVRTIEEIFSR